MACSRRQGLVYRLREDGYSASSDPERLLEIIDENTKWITEWDVQDDIRVGLARIAAMATEKQM